MRTTAYAVVLFAYLTVLSRKKSTIDPNVVQCVVPDKNFKYLADCYKPPSVVPAVLKVTDIAGLIKGASEGAGLGNAFLSHIAAVDGIYHLVRAFEDDEVRSYSSISRIYVHVSGCVS